MEQVLGILVEVVCYVLLGEFFFYQDCKGFEDEWWKYYILFIICDIWLYDIKIGKYINLINYVGEDCNFVFLLDGKSVYFLSEWKGLFNVYSFLLDNV